jgi:5-methylcytosine-specific restriction protein A
MSTRQERRVYRSAAWRELRASVLAAAGGRCAIRGPNCSIRATEVDHIVPMSMGGEAYDPANLRASCKQCNVARSNIHAKQRVKKPSREW